MSNYFTKNRRTLLLQITLLLFVLIFLTICVTKREEHSEEENESSSETTRPIIVWFTDKDEEDIFGLDGKVWWTPEPGYIVNCSVGSKLQHCDIVSATGFTGKPSGYLFYGSFFNRIPLPRDPKTVWGLLHEETPNNMLSFMYEEVLSLFNFSATFSRHSDANMPLLYMQSLEYVTSAAYFVKTSEKNAYLSEIAPVLYLQTNCDTQTDRDDYVKELMKYIKVDSYGLCLHNKQFPDYLSHYRYENFEYLNHVDDTALIVFTAKYKFVVAIENAVCNDYVTEKFWRAIHAGIVPIYFGSPLIRDWMPNKKSAILIEDFPTPELLSTHLHELLQNDTKYEEYLEHKTKSFISNQRIIDEMKAKPYQTNIFDVLQDLYCLMCERIHEFKTNSSRVNIVTKKHYNCSMPTSALTLSENADNKYFKRIKKAKFVIEHI